MTDQQSQGHRTPTADPTTSTFWKALREGRLLIPHCEACRQYSFPPMGSCPHCGNPKTVLKTASGRGNVYSWATVHVPLSPEFVDDVPYTVLVVDLEEGPRIFGRLLGDGQPQAGVDVIFAPRGTGEDAVPGFLISSSGDQPSEVHVGS